MTGDFAVKRRFWKLIINDNGAENYILFRPFTSRLDVVRKWNTRVGRHAFYAKEFSEVEMRAHFADDCEFWRKWGHDFRPIAAKQIEDLMSGII